MVTRKRILVVEDNDLNRAMLCEILSGEYSVLEACNGQEALDMLKKSQDSVSLILLDVMMPVMDGYHFLDRLRAEPELSLIPVIVMTQGSSEEDEVSALAHGATDFVPKPYRPQVILHRVASLIKLRETAAMVNQFQYDRLTGLYSKEFFYRKVRERLDANPEQAYTILCTNIENFKLYNDAFGRRAGDRLLKKVADVAKNMMGSHGFCGRYTADRFLCLQERTQEEQDWQDFGNFPLGEAQSFHNIVMRWGIYEITDPSVPVEQMCDRALLAVDSIKGQYDRYFAVYDDALRGRLFREKAITDAMETALAEEQFVIYLQPKYSLTDNCMAGAEALVRWIHPEWGFMSPGEFIPLFEKNGFIHRLDEYVWEHVCALLAQWKQKGLPLLPVSVNVSRADVYQIRLVDILQGLVQKYDIDPKYLHLEITESAYTENSSQIVATVDQLHALGFPIEMDDFGSGYSSLNMLVQMKLDILKLDMKFVQNEIAKPEDQSILNDIITMAHRLKLGVVAEGVETRAQVSRLLAVGCDYVQGYYFAKPMPVAEFEKLWSAQSSSAVERRSAPVRNDRYTLLVVDEDSANQERIRSAFDGHYAVLTASDADSALACVREHPDIALVILSMTLPGDGAARVMEALRKDLSLWQIPVLASIPNGEAVESLPLTMEADDFLCRCHPMFDMCRRVDRLIDMVRSRKRERELQDEASRDFLTGLLNRRGLQTEMDSLRKEDLPLAVYLFDLDNLKQTNDTCGHDVGDQMIQSFTALLRRQTRAGDVLCRYGGDEFVVILKHLGQGESALKKGRKICDAFRESIDAGPMPPTCSVGIALCGIGERPTMALIERADQAMYRAKRDNKGSCCLWDETAQTEK